MISETCKILLTEIGRAKAKMVMGICRWCAYIPASHDLANPILQTPKIVDKVSGPRSDQFVPCCGARVVIINITDGQNQHLKTLLSALRIYLVLLRLSKDGKRSERDHQHSDARVIIWMALQTNPQRICRRILLHAAPFRSNDNHKQTTNNADAAGYGKRAPRNPRQV